MATKAIEIFEIQNKLKKLPRKKLIEAGHFIDYLLNDKTINSEFELDNEPDFEGIWENCGFENIDDIQSEIKALRKELSASILRKKL